MARSTSTALPTPRGRCKQQALDSACQGAGCGRQPAPSWHAAGLAYSSFGPATLSLYGYLGAGSILSVPV